jgi:alpha-L-arabinofuranosidase
MIGPVRAARMVVDPAFAVGEVDERVFGSFVEHMGRAIYGGI